VGFGGSCFRKDIQNLVYLCEYYNLPEVARYWDAVIEMNEYQKRRFVQRMVSVMFNTLVGKRIAVFGFAFKSNTDDVRESPAIGICQYLLAEQAEVCITDPQALQNAEKSVQSMGGRVTFDSDPYRAAAGAHAIVVLTDWDQYKVLDFVRIHSSMEKPAFVFDGRNCLDPLELHRIGFNVYPIGRVARTIF
jgi:UDPglucose 6-dehydrogenase